MFDSFCATGPRCNECAVVVSVDLTLDPETLDIYFLLSIEYTGYVYCQHKLPALANNTPGLACHSSSVLQFEYDGSRRRL